MYSGDPISEPVCVSPPSPSSSGRASSAFAFVKTGASVWTQQARFSPASGRGVAMSANGADLVVAADADAGVSFATSRSFNNWGPLEPLDRGGGSAALASAGTVAVLGSEPPDAGPGEVWVFTGGAGAWTRRPVLRSPTAAARDGFGGSVAISGDGKYVLVGATGSALLLPAP